MRSILIAIVIIAWILLGWLYCRDHNRCCTDTEGEISSVPIIDTMQVASDMAPAVSGDDDMSGTPVDGRGITNGGRISFNWDGQDPILGDDWSDKRQAILDGLNDNQLLEITGLYRSGETNNSTFENLGLARANEVKKLFIPSLSDDKIVLSSRLTDAGEDDRLKSFEGISFKNIPEIIARKPAGQIAPTFSDDDDTSGTSVDTRGKSKSGPILFEWDGADPVLGDDWSDKRQAILDGLNDNQQLEITGLYRSGETNNSTFENLGLARANEVKKLFVPPLNDDRIVLKSKLIETGDDDRLNSFESVSFRNFTNTAKIKEIDDRTLIYFPYNSTKRLNDEEVEAYLDKVADRVKASGESIRLTGHTDSFGSAESNQLLGRYRADVIKTYLIAKGVPGSRIVSRSKGETDPVATNKTRDGRAQNRRTELQIIK